MKVAMSHTRNIEVSTEVYAAIWRNHREGEMTENDILARLLIGRGFAAISPAISKKKRKWIDDVVDGVKNIGGKGYYSEIYRSVRSSREEGGRRIPPSFEAIVRREIENHSSDSDAFLGKLDLFHAPMGKGAGFWALR